MQQAEREERGEDEADDGVFAQLACAALTNSMRGGGQDAGEEGADGEGQAEHVGAGDAGHDRSARARRPSATSP